MFRRARSEDNLNERAPRPAETEQSPARWQGVIDALPVGVSVFDAEHQMVTMNKAARYAGPGAQYVALVDAAVSRGVQKASNGERHHEALDFAGAQEKSYVVRAEPLKDGEAVAIIEDVSERRNLEAMRRDFVTNVGHEMRTPVGALVVLAETLAGEKDPDTAEEIRKHMVIEANRAAALIDELLSLSQIESQKKVGFVDLPIDALMGEALSRIDASAVAAGVTLEVERVPEGETISGIRGDLLTAITNLLTNAIKYSRTGDRVVVSATVAEGACVFRVTDEGIGIPAKDLDRIFERFYRVDRSRHRATGGSGLGLSIVRHVAANHGGYVSVDSREGEGSTFMMTIPLNPVVS